MNKFLLIWGIIFISIIFNLNYVSAASWYYTDWPYRQVILINNSVPTPDDYQVKIVFDPSNIDYSKTNDDGSDLRFTYYHNGSEEEVNYWIEVWNETGESIVWIKAPKIEGIYYVYYGNRKASTESNIHTTFIFGDDFEDGVIDNSLWKAGGPVGVGTWVEDNGVLSQTSKTQTLKSMLINLSESSWVASVKMRPDSWGDDYRGGLAGRETPGEGYSGNYSNKYIGFYGHVFTISYTNRSKVRWLKEHYRPFSDAWGPEVDPGFTFSIGTWYNIETAFINPTSIKGRVWKVGEPTPEWQVTNNDMNPLTNNNTGMYGGYMSTFSFDDFRVRKYSFPEPSYEIGGVETKEPPRLVDTDVENLYEGSIDDLLREFFTARYIRVLLTAWISHDDLVGSVKSNFSAEGGIVIPDNFPMGRVEGGEYSLVYEVASAVEIAQKAVGFLVSYLTSGTELNLLEFQPEVRWKYVIVNATYGDSRPYMVDKRLPSILEGLPKKFTGRATMFMSACPVDMLVTDPEGRRTGSLYENGEFKGVVNEIERSVYTGRGVEPEFVVIFDPKEGEYGIEVHGNGTGTYNFSVISVDNGSVFYRKDYTNVPIEEGETHTYEEPVTDIEPPEAVIGYDPVSEELVVEGKDNFDENVSVSYDEGCSKRLFGFCLERERDYTLSDDAGNSLVLSIGYNKIQHANRRGGFSFIHARLLRAKYVTGEGSKEYEYARNLLSYRINKKSGKTEYFSQGFYMKGRGVIRTRYEPKKNETRVWGKWEGKPRREVLEGFKVLKITTDLDEFVNIDV